MDHGIENRKELGKRQQHCRRQIAVSSGYLENSSNHKDAKCAQKASDLAV